MSIIDPRELVRAMRARDDRSSSFGGLCRRVLRAAAQTWRWIPVLAVPILFTGRGGRPWLEVHPPPPDASATSAAPPAAPEMSVAANGFGAVLSAPMQAQVEKWVHRFRTDERSEFQRLLDREGIYGSLIRSKLRQRGMPADLLYLAMMESGLSPRAVSGASAVGVWQLMVPTALQYGLRVDKWVDQRRDPVRATDAALDYLQALHDRYGSWYLAAVAYNAGPGRVDRAIDEYAGGRFGEPGLYWKVIGHLPPETRAYVPRILAATYLARYASYFGFATNDVAPYRYESVFMPGGTSLASVAHVVQVRPTRLSMLNPQLIQGVTPPGEAYPVRVPPGTSGAVVAFLDVAGHGAPTR